MKEKRKGKMCGKKKTTSCEARGRRLADFPSDIAREILSRLPLASMMRFKFVCKTWYDMVTELQITNGIILVPKQHQWETLFLKDEREANRICRQLPMRFLPSDYYNVTVAGCCNGLLCIVSPKRYWRPEYNGACIYNPITEVCVELPHQDPCMDQYMLSYGFGFDSVSKKYKVVSVYREYYSSRGMIITLGEDKSWRRIDLPYNVELRRSTHAVVHDGLFHWLIEEDDRTSGSEKILALDINSEKFYSFRFPASVELPDPSDSCLMKLSDSLAIVVCDESHNLFRIWQIDGPNTNRRWVKQYTIELSPGICDKYFCEMSGMSGDGNLVFVATEKIIVTSPPYNPKGHLIRYHPRKKCISVMEMVGAPDTFTAHFFVPTLVSPMSLCCRNKKNRKSVGVALPEEHHWSEGR